MGSSLYILGVRVDNVTEEEALAQIEGFVLEGSPHQVATINPEFMVQAQQDQEFRRILNRAALCLPDGAGLLWASRILGSPLRERVAGVDMVHRLAGLAASKGYRLFLLGAAPGVAEATARILQREHPALIIAGTSAGSPAAAEDEAIGERVRAAAPHLLLVAYGAPQQERWIARNLSRLSVPVAMGVGGAFDFISGRLPRAPRWMQRRGLEWLHRLIHEPWRWRRMLRLPLFVLLVLRSWWQQRPSP